MAIPDRDAAAGAGAGRRAAGAVWAGGAVRACANDAPATNIKLKQNSVLVRI
jgi:hypothetical protein